MLSIYQTTTDLIEGLDILGAEGTRIPNNSDLNDYVTAGKYYVTSGSSSATIANSPSTSTGYILFIITGRRIWQVAFLNTNMAAFRNKSDSSDYSSWYTLSGS